MQLDIFLFCLSTKWEIEGGGQLVANECEIFDTKQDWVIYSKVGHFSISNVYNRESIVANLLRHHRQLHIYKTFHFQTFR